ncbi:MAG: PGPGW domain-containing protein [Gaiellaceae bacterium]
MAVERNRYGRTMERVRERKERHKQRGKLYRAAFVIVGALLILAGVALSLPGVPGPGLIVIAVGLGILALEFDRAERLLERLLERLERMSDQTSRAPAWLRTLGFLALVLLAVGSIAVVVFLDISFFPG